MKEKLFSKECSFKNNRESVLTFATLHRDRCLTEWTITWSRRRRGARQRRSSLPRLNAQGEAAEQPDASHGWLSLFSCS